MRDFDTNSITEAQSLAASAADEADAVLIEIEVVLFRQDSDVNEAADGDFDSLAEQAEAFDSRDDRVQFFANSFRHESEQFQFRQFAFGSGRATFHVRTMLAEDFQFRFAGTARSAGGDELIEQ